MKKVLLISVFLGSLVSLGSQENLYSQEIKKEDLFFFSSLHYTTKGMAYWYDKANGGLETIVGIPYAKLDCQNCHIPACDTCHKKVIDGKAFYSKEAARNQEICLHCHKREATIMQIDRTAKQIDVHAEKGMQCVNCHTAREVHGDGTEYSSMKQKGAMDAACVNCHKSVTSSVSHKIHRDKLDCEACHVRHVLSCSNCHFYTLVKEGKRVAIPLTDWVFLMNYNGKVTSANMQTFVVPDNKTFLMFAPANSHSIMKDGRKCGDCHGTEIVKQVQKGKISLTWLESGKLDHLKGVIPVVEGVTYESVYQNYQDGKWIPIENPPAPLLHYAGFGKPLSAEQLKKLAQPMSK
ncbi:MAG: hypothetical protein AB1638_01955 [Nitrospirota bacterium]